MFQFFSSNRAVVFEERRKKQEVWRSLRRIIDRRSYKEMVVSEDNRKEPRHAISIPVLVHGYGSHCECTPEFAVSKNISEEGMALLCPIEIVDHHVFCAVWEEHPVCFLGTVRQSHYVGGGYWEVGIEFQEMTTMHDWEPLRSMAQNLNPHSR